MAGFSSYDDLIAEVAAGKKAELMFVKAGTTTVVNAWQSLARVAGYPIAITDGAAGSGTPGAGGTALTNAAGTLTLPDTSPDLKYILSIGSMVDNANNLLIYDRLVHVSGISVASTGSKNVGSAALPRYTGTNSVGVQVWLEFTTANTTTAPVVHLLTYTNENGTTGRVGDQITLPAAAMTLGTMYGPLPLQAGDLGIRSVETLNVDTAGTAGVVQLVLLRPLAMVSMPASKIWQETDFILQMADLPRVYDGASIQLMYTAVASSSTSTVGKIVIGWG